MKPSPRKACRPDALSKRRSTKYLELSETGSTATALCPCATGQVPKSSPLGQNSFAESVSPYVCKRMARAQARQQLDLLASSRRSSQAPPIATARNRPLNILSATFQSPLLCPPAAGRGGILNTFTSLQMYRVCSTVSLDILIEQQRQCYAGRPVCEGSGHDLNQDSFCLQSDLAGQVTGCAEG